MPHLDFEIHDFAGSSVFASLYFVSAYWQLTLHKNSYTACEVGTPKQVMASKLVLFGLANATKHSKHCRAIIRRASRQHEALA